MTGTTSRDDAESEHARRDKAALEARLRSRHAMSTKRDAASLLKTAAAEKAAERTAAARASGVAPTATASATVASGFEDLISSATARSTARAAQMEAETAARKASMNRRLARLRARKRKAAKQAKKSISRQAQTAAAIEEEKALAIRSREEAEKHSRSKQYAGLKTKTARRNLKQAISDGDVAQILACSKLLLASIEAADVDVDDATVKAALQAELSGIDALDSPAAVKAKKREDVLKRMAKQRASRK